MYAVKVKTHIWRSDPSPKLGSIAFTHFVAVESTPLIILTRIRSCALEDTMLLADAMLAMRRDIKVASSWNVFIVVIIGMCSATTWTFQRCIYTASESLDWIAGSTALSWEMQNTALNSWHPWVHVGACYHFDKQHERCYAGTPIIMYLLG